MEYLIITPLASVIFAITLITSLLAFYNQNLYGKMMLHPYTVSRGHQIYTIFTSGLIHKDMMHLMFNMLSYYFFAFRLEQQMGHWQFAVLYIVSLILSDMPSVIKHKENYSYYSLGASGAISAVIFGAILYSPLDRMGILILPILIPAYVFGILYLVYCSYASKYARDNINHDAHLYGALSGLMITILLNPAVLPQFIQQISGAIQSLLH
ncbi:rhomboid family intramembrane serine protease [Mucilaginibacter sp. SP1R1]|uniref:rhomboid family intramembrane serine protease n=1 Tax=Mucilaginibacter sp. SP1R1 TaxID=2723091 RepID=UPI0016215A68|nr:rhomboid family intramembrane serine protease [Mucilaginibacter sp. SP1R1]MBB6147882.1 membrane associated rhomboid family serine protease [Mucilaginibacter sp. SP1R1]